jgi:glycosyltransferase involved in cell wall biosynthesis
MKKYKICFWLNVPSNHQTLFLEALNQDKRIDLQVRYFDKPTEDRLSLGWRDENSLNDYEQYVDTAGDGLRTMGDWQERIHITIGYSYPFNKELVPMFIETKVKWVHWSERYGIGLAQRLRFNITLFKLLRPLFLLTKRSYGSLVNKYAFGCYAQGVLACKDFIIMGIDESKIEDLFYTTESPRDDHIVQKSFAYKYNFIYVGRLNKGKGIEDLLRSYNDLTNADDWGLVLVGNDETNGYYQELSKKLGIDKKIQFVGGVKAEEVLPYFNGSDVFVMPSRYDGWGAVVNEAASMGLPLIGSDQLGASHHLIKSGENGYMFEAGDVQELTYTMQQYISYPELIKKHGARSKEIYEEFSPEKNVERFVSAMDKWGNRVNR